MVAAAVMLVAVALNVFGGQLVLWLDLPLYLDMIGTAAVAFAFGPWYAVATAIATQLTGAALHQSAVGLPYTPVAVVGALVWGYGIHRWKLGRTPARFLALSILVAVVCTLVAVPITAIVFDGFSAHVAGNTLTERFQGVGESLALALASSNLITSVLDKLIASFLGLTIGASLRSLLSIDAGSRGAEAIGQFLWSRDRDSQSRFPLRGGLMALKSYR